MKFQNAPRKNRIKFLVYGGLMLLLTIWSGNYWWLLLEAVLYDHYIIGKRNWTFWKKKDVRPTGAVAWVDAIIYATIFATLVKTLFIQAYVIPTSSMENSLLTGDFLFVSNFKYGPRVPQTPLSFPFVHHTLPFTQSTPSYLTWWKWDDKRLAGYADVKRNDIVVFNFPAGDTIIVGSENPDYYSQIAMTAYQIMKQQGGGFAENKAIAKQYINERAEIRYRPVDKRENYVKRCVAVAGETIEIRAGDLYIDGEKQDRFEGQKYKDTIWLKATLDKDFFSDFNISDEDKAGCHIQGKNAIIVPLTQSQEEEISQLPFVQRISRQIDADTLRFHPEIYPHHPDFDWTEDFFGPLYIPKAGETIDLSLENYILYKRIISAYEGNDLQVKKGVIYINGAPAKTYTFQMDYYWMMGDNRHSSADSRFWGFVPENHITGTPIMIWLSWNGNDGKFPIRWSRLFNIL